MMEIFFVLIYLCNSFFLFSMLRHIELNEGEIIQIKHENGLVMEELEKMATDDGKTITSIRFIPSELGDVLEFEETATLYPGGFNSINCSDNNNITLSSNLLNAQRQRTELV